MNLDNIPVIMKYVDKVITGNNTFMSRHERMKKMDDFKKGYMTLSVGSEIWDEIVSRDMRSFGRYTVTNRIVKFIFTEEFHEYIKMLMTL